MFICSAVFFTPLLLPLLPNNVLVLAISAVHYTYLGVALIKTWGGCRVGRDEHV